MAPRLAIVTCSKTGQAPTLMGSLRRHSYTNCFCVKEVSSIAVGFNSTAKRVRKGEADVFAFTHDDVAVLSSHANLIDAAELAMQPETGVVGVAGTQYLGKDGIWWAGGGSLGGGPAALSGACMHTDGKKVWMSSFGPFGRVVVLDGVFLMMRREVFEKVERFDESYPGFDFYDIDITLRAHLAGLKNYTHPFHLIHHSVGDVSQKPQWHKNRERFCKKWEAVLPATLEVGDEKAQTA